MLGLGVPGVWFTLCRPGPRSLELSLVLSGLTMPASIIALFKGSELLPRVWGLMPGLSAFANPQLVLVLVALLTPMLCLGSAVCLLLMQAEGREVGRMYAADLLGATLGAVSVVPLMHVVPTPHIVAGAGLLPLGAALLLTRRIHFGVVAAAAAVLASLVAREPLHLRVAKSYVEPDNLLYVKWTPTARITIHPSIFYVKDPSAGFGWGMGWNYEPKPLPQLWIEQDASAGRPITHLKTTPAALSHLFFDVTSIGYQLRTPRRVCIVGAGGGRDILTALKAGATHVDAVELNGHIVDALSGPFREFSGDVYHLPGVHPVVGEGRSFLTHSDGNYDFIQISLIDSWAATTAGAFALSENYLYTVEALRLYLQKTLPNGVVSISRWMSGDRQLEGARLAQLATRALELEGIADAARHVVVFQAWDVGTFLVSRAPFDAARLAKLDDIADQRGFRRRWPVPEETDHDTVVASVMSGGSTQYEKVGLDRRPAVLLSNRFAFRQSRSRVLRDAFQQRARGGAPAHAALDGERARLAFFLFAVRLGGTHQADSGPLVRQRLLLVHRSWFHARGGAVDAEVRPLPRPPELRDDRGARLSAARRGVRIAGSVARRARQSEKVGPRRSR